MLTLADAITEENINLVRKYLQQGVDINDVDEYGFTPLIEAAIADHVEITKLLLQFGANPNLQDLTGGTALHWAAENNNYALSQLLLQAGANPNAYTFAGQSALVMPQLRQQKPLKTLLQEHGANLDFALDYINAKLLGHMFELVGTAFIISPANDYVELDFEGFYLEFTLALISESLSQFKNHFAARELRRYTHLSQVIVQVLERAAQLIKYQQYRVDLNAHRAAIDALVQQDLLVIPIGYEGHAITFIKFGNILVKCDRREDSRLYDNVYFYYVGRTDIFTTDFIKSLIFTKQSSDFINTHLPLLLELKPITELKVAAQISGNCSWANVEACIPALLFLMFSQEPDFEENTLRYKNIALNFFQQWREWNKTRSLNFCIQSFKTADSIRKACKAEILAAILFQCCLEENALNQARITEILTILTLPKYKHILQNYIRTYCYEDYSEEGEKFLRVLKEHGYQDDA